MIGRHGTLGQNTVCKRFLRAAGLCILIIGLTSCSIALNKESYQVSAFLFDTEVSLEIYGAGSQAAGERAIEMMTGLDSALNIYESESEMAKVNQSAGKNPMTVSADTFAIISEALEIAELTGGAYNPAIGPLVELWRISQEKGTLPQPAEIQALLPLTDFRAVALDESTSTVFLPVEGMRLDLGGIAKGFAVERAVSILKDAGIESAKVAAGGNVYAIGSKQDGSPWRIGIRNPKKQNEIVGYVELKDQGIDTSGDYERFFEIDGNTYGHILDPSTGYPPKGVISCSIVADRPTLADALATATFLMGQEKGLPMLEAMSAVEGMIIDEAGTLHMTPGFEKIFALYD